MVQDVHAQASASVSYTIVVSEDMLAGRGGDQGMDLTRVAPENREQAPQSSVSVSFSSDQHGQAHVFETEMSPEQAPAIAGMVEDGITPAPIGQETADVKSERIEEEEGEYLVVMEFN